MKKYNKWSEQEIQFLKDNYQNLTEIEMGERLSRSKISVGNRIRWLKSKGVIPYVTKNTNILRTKYGKVLINKVKKYYKKGGLCEVIEQTDLTETEIRNIVASLGFSICLSRKAVPRIIQLQKILEFTSESCYILGFLWGDGTVNDHQVGINNLREDVNNLISIFYTVGNWQIAERKQKNRRPQLGLFTNDRAFINFLKDYGYFFKKSASAESILRLIPKDKQKYWWRGFFDADGHIGFEETPSGGVKKVSFSLSSSYGQDWEFVLNLFKELDIISYQVYRHIRKNNKGKFSAIRMDTLLEIKKFLDYIYLDYNHIGLGRKYRCYLSINENLEFRKTSPYFKHYLTSESI